MKSCKFCGDTAHHINRDNLCARCYRILEKAKLNKLTEDEQGWFEDMCRWNFEHGMFVPIKQRRAMRRVWRCKGCGTTDITRRDDSYTNYCFECAHERRLRR